MERQLINIYTDGSCYWKIRKGGCGAYIRYGDEEFFISKGYKKTTISRCELRAVILAIQSLNENICANVNIFSDSQYVVNGWKDHLLEWYENNWENCMNADLWKLLLTEIRKRKRLHVKFHWHPGHRTNYDDPIVYGNVVADMLANYKNFTEYELDVRS